MTKEDRKIEKQLVDEMMKVSKTNPDVMIYMQALMENYEKLDNELTRSNNIINELEKYLDGRYNEWKDSDNDIIRESAYEDLRILDYLKELKEFKNE